MVVTGPSYACHGLYQEVFPVDASLFALKCLGLAKGAIGKSMDFLKLINLTTVLKLYPHLILRTLKSRFQSPFVPLSQAELEPIPRVIPRKEPLGILHALGPYQTSALFSHHCSSLAKTSPGIKKQTYRYLPHPAYLPPEDSPHPSVQNAPKPSSLIATTPPETPP
jgi:hypothetical protein